MKMEEIRGNGHQEGEEEKNGSHEDQLRLEEAHSLRRKFVEKKVERNPDERGCEPRKAQHPPASSFAVMIGSGFSTLAASEEEEISDLWT